MFTGIKLQPMFMRVYIVEDVGEPTLKFADLAVQGNVKGELVTWEICSAR